MEQFSALVLSQDHDALRIINKAFDEYGLKANIVPSIGDANEMLKDQRFDLAVCDYDFPGAGQLAYLDPATPWRGIVFGLVRLEQVAKVSGRRVHLTMPKPLTPGFFCKGLRAAYATMAHEKRAAFRYTIDVDANWAQLFDHGEEKKIEGARVLNVSRSGMCLQTPELLRQHVSVRLSFELPKHGGSISVEGEVVWAKAPGRAGIRFSHISDASQKILTEWIEAELPPEFNNSPALV